MTIRSTLILLALPLFLALALVNGALLYVEERDELTRALDEQARAAAVTVAAFVAEMERPEEELGTPLRARALRSVAHRIDGLDGLFLTQGERTIALAPATDGWRPSGAGGASGPGASAADPPYVVASAPAGQGAFVTARIDGGWKAASLSQARRILALVLAVAVLTAVALGWLVARRIVRELRANRRAIAAALAGEEPVGDAALTMREPRDLADAVRLMVASRDAAALHRRRVRARQDAERGMATALAACRADLFAPVTGDFGGCLVAVRLMGEPPPGSFFAVCRDAGVTLVLGQCHAEAPEDALALAQATRRFLEAQVPRLGCDAALALASDAYGAADCRRLEWREGDRARRLIALSDDETERRATTYAEWNKEAAPERLLDGIAALLGPAGAFAAAAPVRSGECGERAGDIILHGEDAREPADIEDFPDRG